MSAAKLSGGLGSMLVHAAVVFALLPAIPAKSPAAPAKPVAHRSNEEADMVLIPESVSYGDGLSCPEWYRGIGVIVGFSGLVEEVVERGPADRAGLKVGDRFFNEQIFIRDRYAIGHALTLRVERDGREMELPVTIGRVCYSTQHTIPHLTEGP